MSHPDEGVLQELLDGELAPADAAAVRAHVADCVPCAVTLRDLGATQAEADAIVSRLPLEPPVVRPQRGARPRRAINLRLIGLAASAVLVAGTSWVLLRSSPSVPARLPTRDDAASGVVLPLPGQEHEEPPAATPAAPPAPAVADLEREKVAEPYDTRDQAVPQKQAKAKEADLAAAAKDEQAAGRAQTPAEEKPLANAAAPAPRLAAAPTSASRLTVSTPHTPEAVEGTLGWRFLSIEGLNPVSIEIVGSQADSSQELVQRYVVNGTPVRLTQRRSLVSADSVASRSQGFDAMEQTAKAARNVRIWKSGGILLELEAALPGDSLNVLQQRVK